MTRYLARFMYMLSETTFFARLLGVCCSIWIVGQLSLSEARCNPIVLVRTTTISTEMPRTPTTKYFASHLPGKTFEAKDLVRPTSLVHSSNFSGFLGYNALQSLATAS